MLSDPFSSIVGQAGAVRTLKRALIDGRLTNAFMFVGPDGCGRFTTALAFSKALLCADGGCGHCRSCQRIDRLIHPDLCIIEPEGEWLLIDQVHEVISESQLNPIESARRVTIFPAAERFNTPSANAFLKTLEEPEPGNVYILIASDEDDVLPTITSRCEKIRFLRIEAAQAATIAAEVTGVSMEAARAAVRSSKGSIGMTIMLLQDGAARRIQDLVSGFLSAQDPDCLASMAFSDNIRSTIDSALNELKLNQEKEVEQLISVYGEGRGTAGLKDRLMKRQKRQMKAARQTYLNLVMDEAVRWYRDHLMVQRQDSMSDNVTSDNVFEATRATQSAIEKIDCAREMLKYQVSEQSVLEDLAMCLGDNNAGSHRRIV